MDLTVERREEAETRCAYCRATLDGGLERGLEGPAEQVECACGTRLHRECLDLNGGRCTTVGCEGQGVVAAARAPAAPAIRPDPALAVVGLAIAAQSVAGAAGRWVHLALALALVPLLAATRRLSGAWSRAEAIAMALGLQALAFSTLDLGALRDTFDAWRAAPGIALAGAALGCLAAALVRPRPSKVAPPPARWQLVALALALLATGTLAARSGTGELTRYWRDRLLLRGDADDVAAVLWDVGEQEGPGRWAAERAIEGLDDPGVNPTLITLLGHADRWLRIAAAEALGHNRASGPVEREALARALEGETRAENRAAITGALRRIDGRSR